MIILQTHYQIMTKLSKPKQESQKPTKEPSKNHQPMAGKLDKTHYDLPARFEPWRSSVISKLEFTKRVYISLN